VPSTSGTPSKRAWIRSGTTPGSTSFRPTSHSSDALLRCSRLQAPGAWGARSASPPRASLAAEWDAALQVLPGDWSDLLCDLELGSSDYIERAALLLAPLNPIQGTGRPGFRFRCAHSFGYGASAGMVRRCLARLDEERIAGEVRVLRALSDTHPVGTQGPVWRIGERSV
jgi:hypothetical protein